MLILKQNQIHLSSRMNMSSPKCSIYSAVLHTLPTVASSCPGRDHPNTEIPDPQTTPECKHTHTSRETQYHHTTFPHIHTHKLETHKQTCWSVHPLNACTNRQKHIHFSCSNTPFIQWLKVTSHTEDKHQLTALIFIAKAVSTHFHSTRL